VVKCLFRYHQLPVQTWLEHFGVAVSAIAGVLAARGKRVDLFGVLVLALVTAFGGGTVRDLLIGDLHRAHPGAAPHRHSAENRAASTGAGARCEVKGQAQFTSRMTP